MGRGLNTDYTDSTDFVFGGTRRLILMRDG